MRVCLRVSVRVCVVEGRAGMVADWSTSVIIANTTGQEKQLKMPQRRTHYLLLRCIALFKLEAVSALDCQASPLCCNGGHGHG